MGEAMLASAATAPGIVYGADSSRLDRPGPSAPVLAAGTKG